MSRPAQPWNSILDLVTNRQTARTFLAGMGAATDSVFRALQDADIPSNFTRDLR